MPITYGAEHVEKRLSSRDRGEPQAVLDLRSEAALLSRLSTLRVTPRFIEMGEDAAGPWHRIERLAFATLAARLERHSPVDGAWIERVVPAAFDALARLHEAADASGPLDVIHADVSPANLAIDDAASEVVFLDFNLAWWREGPARDGAFRGTIAYAAPEIARGERPSPACDLFSLAASLLHAVTGYPPRMGSSFAALVVAAAEDPLLSPEDCAAISARGKGHAALVACLAHAPAERPRSARAVLEMLR